jgi:hypothetical protein
MRHAILSVSRIALGLFAVLNEGPKDADLVVLVPKEVKTILLAEAHLQKVVVQTLLGDTDPDGSVLKGVAYKLAVSDDTVVQPPPKADLLYNIFNRPFLGALLRL